MASYTAGTPDAFAALWLNRNVSRYRGPLGAATRHFGRAQVAFPGTPTSALVAFCSGATEFENTGALIRGQVSNPLFCETSFYGNESGPTFAGANAASCSARRTPFAQCTFGPVPNPDPDLPYSNYARFATNEMIRRPEMLGRNASLAPGSCFDVSEGTAVAMLNLRWHAGMVASYLPAELRPSRPDTLWGIALAFGGWSAGDARWASHILRYAAELGRVHESARLGLMGWLIARDALARRLPTIAARSHANPAYTYMRTAQKIGAGEAVEIAANGSAASTWYRSPLVGAQRNAVFDVLARAAYGVPVRATDIGQAPMLVAPSGEVWMPSGIVLSAPQVRFYHAQELDRVVARLQQKNYDGLPYGLELMQSYGGKVGPKQVEAVYLKGPAKA